jgi:hypothetical protein
MNEITILALLTAANRYDTQTFLDFFATNAVIDDVSVGEKFEQHSGIKKYFSTYFIAYHTITQLLSIEQISDDTVLVKIDFTGDFGHETGGLKIRYDETGLISNIEAYLD